MNENNFKYDLGVLGLGYVGLPLALSAFQNNLKVVGFDISVARIDSIKSGLINEPSFNSQEIDDFLVTSIFTSDFRELANASTLCICVPTPIGNNNAPDLSFILGALDIICKILTRGQLIIVESTIWPGTTRTIIKNFIEARTKLVCSVDFYLAFSPERIDPGNEVFRIHNVPKIVGGVSKIDADLAKLFYEKFIPDVYVASNPDTAEAVKILENIFRHVNIALINEFSLACKLMDLDVFEIIKLASTKPYGFMPFYPSAGAGGHCIPVDPLYFNHIYKLNFNNTLKFVDLANDINEYMPQHYANLAITKIEELGKSDNATVGILGISYKANIGDTRESPALKISKLLSERRLTVLLHEPNLSSENESFQLCPGVNFEFDLEKVLKNSDIVLLLQPHNQYSESKVILDWKHKIISALAPDFF